MRYAVDNVPYYRELFRARNLEPASIRAATDLDQLPIVEKAELRAAPDFFRARSAAGRQSIPFTTSGTTGEPLIVFHDRGSIVDNIAYCEPEKQVVREILGQSRGGPQLSIIYGGSTIRKIWSVYRDLTFVPLPAEDSVLSIEAAMDDVIARINEVEPAVLSGYGSYLEALFRYIDAKGINMHLPKLVNYGADAMTQPGRDLIQQHYGVPILSRYSAVECFRIGFTCREGTGFHVRDDLCHLRIVDENGCNLPPGVTGQVVISNLVNRGTVLLNYRLGDVGALSDAPCPCGRQLPLLTGLDGRSEDVLTLMNGTIVHPRVIWSAIKKQRGIVRYQLIQHEPDRFELRLVTAEGSDFDRISTDTLKDLRHQLPDSVVECVHTDHIATPAGGKFRPVVALSNVENDA